MNKYGHYVELIDENSWYTTIFGARTCYNSRHLSNNESDLALLKRLSSANPKHKSVFEHKYFQFHLKGYSRSVLQELSRHRIMSPSVKSTRYTIKELLKCTSTTDFLDFLVPDEFGHVWDEEINILKQIKSNIEQNVKNDIVKRRIPESFKTESLNTINFSSLMNLFDLRISKRAFPEFKALAELMCDMASENELTKEIIEAWRNG